MKDIDICEMIPYFDALDDELYMFYYSNIFEFSEIREVDEFWSIVRNQCEM